MSNGTDPIYRLKKDMEVIEREFVARPIDLG